MMNPPVISNSGSLEDCHTNFFALTDLCGIRWKKFVFVEPSIEPLEDPILKSYARCLRESILCVWRRVTSKTIDSFQTGLYEARPPNSITYPPLSLKTSKELWIFWYGEEPDLSVLLETKLMEPTVETGEGSYDSGISYETRSLLFKALHNSIERRLLSRGIMRLGKWFVQPCTKENCSIENGYHHMSFSFGFFVHGESTVCTSVDLRNHPNVRRLTEEHVKEAALNSDFNQYPVILAPYGLAGTLTGKSFKASDPIGKKTLEEWSMFYPLRRKTDNPDPPVVEVIAGGVKMYYPANYVLLTDIDDEDFSFDSIPKMYQQDDMNEIENENKITTPVGLENVIGERVWQECVVSSQILASHQQDEDNNRELSNDKEPYFEHPTTRTVCNCTIRKNPEKQSNCYSHQHGNQLVSDISSAMNALGPNSSPELSPLFQYPSSVSPPEYELQAHPIPSPNQLSSQYELQNFLNSSSDYDDTHSPFVLTAEQQQNNTLTPNPSPDSIADKTQIDPISPVEMKPSGKLISDDDSREKFLQIKTEAGKSLNLQSSDLTALDSANISNALDINIKTENIANDIDMDSDHNSMSGTNFLNTELANIFGDTGSNENETKMSFESNDQNKKSIEKDQKNENESSDSDDEDDSDSDESDDSDDDDSSASENSDDASDVDQKGSSKDSDGKTKKSGSSDDGHDRSGGKSSDSKDCDSDKLTSESLEKILSEGLPAKILSDSSDRNSEKDKNSMNDRDSPRTNDKHNRMSIENADSNSDPFGLQQRSDGSKSDNAQNNPISNADLNNDNHSNISDSDVGDHLDDSSNDSAKSASSFMARLTGRKENPLSKDDGIGADANADLKNKSNEYRNFLDDLATSDSSDSNGSEKDSKSRFSKGLDLSGVHEGHSKTTPSPDSKLKSLDSAIGSKSVEDDNAMSDLHTDNISDDEYDIKPDSILGRKNDNFSVNANVRNSETFESIANYISPAPSTAIISADYSNLSDNNDTNSNDNNRDDSKRPSPSGNRNENLDANDGNSRKDATDADLLAKKLLDAHDTKLSDPLTNTSESNKSGSINKSPFRTDNKNDQKEIIDLPKVDVLLSAETVCKSDNFGLDESTTNKSEFGSSDLKSDGSSLDGKGADDGNQNESLHKTDDDLDFSLNFFDEHSQSGILENLIPDSTKGKDDNDMGTLLPPSSTGLSLAVDSDSLSNIIDSMKSPMTADIKRSSLGSSPNNPANTPGNIGDDKLSKNMPPYISPAREHGHCMESSTGTAGDKNDDSNIPKSGDDSNSFDDINLGGKDNLSTIDMNKRRPNEMTRELELKIENPTEFLPEQITSIKSEEMDAIASGASNSDKKTSSSSKSSGSGGSSENSKKSSESNKSKKDGDTSTSKSSSSSSKSSSKSSKKSKHSKVESSSASSSKKSSKTSSKSDKNKSNDPENTKNNENTVDASGNQSSSRKSKEHIAQKRTLKPSKRSHRTAYSNANTQMAKRCTYSSETLAALMKTPSLGIRHHDIIAECAESPQMLYDFTTWEAWMNHPVKRFKTGENFPSRAVFKELQELYSKQNVSFADLKNHPPNSVESKSISDGLHTSDEDADQDYYNDSGSNSNLSDYDLNSPDILCSPTNFSDIYFEGNRNLSLVGDLGGNVGEPDSSDNSNEGSIQDWTFNLSSSKYAPLTNIAPTQTYLQRSFVYQPSWENRNVLGKSANRKNKSAGNSNSKSGLNSSKSKNKNRHKGGSSTANKPDAEKARGSKYPEHTDVKRELDFDAKSKVRCYAGPQSKNRGTIMTIKEEPISDNEIRNESDSDSDSETDKRSNKKSGSDKRSGKKSSKSGKSLEASRRSAKVSIKSEHRIDDGGYSFDNNGNSDENSNDSGQSIMKTAAANLFGQEISAIKVEHDGNPQSMIPKSNIKMEPSDKDGDCQTTNLDKSSSSVEEFDNDKPSKLVTVHINLDYDSEVYNEEVNARKFHKYQKNIDSNNLTGNFQMQQFQSTAEPYPFDGNAGSSAGGQLEGCFSGVNSDSDSDDSDAANDLDDSDSSCDECSAGPCSTSILPPLQYENAASPTSIASYYNKNFNYLENIAQPVQRLPETNALILNLMLYDTSLNVFRDHNFDSCSLCVCHPAGDGTFGNIRGNDSGRYLPLNGHSFSNAMNEAAISLNPIGQFETESDRNKRARNAHLMGYLDTDPIHCSCGYSAIVNRRLSHKTGLFYDDENEITGMAEDPQEVKIREKQMLLLKSGSNSVEEFVFGVEKICGAFSQVIMDYIQEQCTCVQNSANSVQRSIRFANNSIYFNIESSFLNIVEFYDAQDITRVALNNSKYESLSKARKNNAIVKSNAGGANVHKWPYIKAGLPPNNKDGLKFMQMLMPVLQGSFNKKYMTRMWEAPYTIQGPLTWRQFHRLASNQSGQSEPQPIPSIVVGHEKEWLSVSPFAIQYWDQLMLEPYSYTRDVAYIVVAPDNDYIVDEAKQFFKELSTMYEMCKLGRHCPIKGCDGVLRSGKNTTEIVNDEFEELYSLFEDNKTIEMIKSYVQTCQQHLVPYLTNISSDKSILDPEPEGFNIKDFCYRDKSMSSPMFQPDTPEFSYGGGENKEQNSSFESECDSNASYNNAQTPQPAAPVPNEPIVLTSQNEDEIPPCIIIYLLNPLSFGHESDDLQRLSCIALLRSYSKILNGVPDSIRNNIKLQIISLESILEMGQNCDLLRASDEMRCLALSIFSQCRRNLSHDVTAKILTGFGTAANLQMVIKNKDCNNRTPYKLYAPPYILSGREETIESSEVFGASTVDTPSSVLYCNYCLSEDQKWLLAVATDERGELLETITINIEVTNADRNAANRADSVRRQSLQKLMDFIVGIISQTSQQWRIVIGRIGRIGHGELKAWSWLLCKSSLVKVSKQLKDVCDQCSMMYLHSCPSIVSACLLTLEPDTSFRILSDQFTPDERFSQIAMQSTLSTPSDLSCTHILVLPINAAAQAALTYPEHHITDFSEEELFVSLDNSTQGMGGINGLSNINNMNSINGMNNMHMNGMNSMNGMNVMNGIGGLNNIAGMNIGGGNMNNLNGMNGLNALNNMNNLGDVNSMNGLGDANSINGLNSMNGIDAMDGIDGIDPMEGMDGIDGIDAMEAMEAMDDVNMNNIEDFFGNDWESEIQIPNENPHDDSTLDVKLDSGVNPNDGNQQLLEPKIELGQDMKQDHDQKPNLMLSVNMSGLGHQVKLDPNCDTGNMQMQMQLHNTSDEFGQMMQQPLAIGFMVSTAPINRMPPWFWANCPQLEHVNPVFLKSSLHIHSPLIHQNSNEPINQRFSHAGHPLDSMNTANTMRYILESYNFLSWLAIDPNTNDRISCLPAHIQVLMQLYNMIAAFT